MAVAPPLTNGIDASHLNGHGGAVAPLLGTLATPSAPKASAFNKRFFAYGIVSALTTSVPYFMLNYSFFEARVAVVEGDLTRAAIWLGGAACIAAAVGINVVYDTLGLKGLEKPISDFINWDKHFLIKALGALVMFAFYAGPGIAANIPYWSSANQCIAQKDWGLASQILTVLNHIYVPVIDLVYTSGSIQLFIKLAELAQESYKRWKAHRAGFNFVDDTDTKLVPTSKLTNTGLVIRAGSLALGGASISWLGSLYVSQIQKTAALAEMPFGAYAKFIGAENFYVAILYLLPCLFALTNFTSKGFELILAQARSSMIEIARCNFRTLLALAVGLIAVAASGFTGVANATVGGAGLLFCFLNVPLFTLGNNASAVLGPIAKALGQAEAATTWLARHGLTEVAEAGPDAPVVVAAS